MLASVIQGRDPFARAAAVPGSFSYLKPSTACGDAIVTMMTSPKRRWFAFSLRTLFVVVTVVGMGLGWVVYQLNWIRQRRAVIARPDILSWSRFSVEPLASPPWTLRPFAERGFYTVDLIIVDNDRAIVNEMDVTADDSRLTAKERDEVLELGRLFPEAFTGAWFRKGSPAPLNQPTAR